MVGNKAQKAVAAALTGLLAMGTAAPAFAGVQLSNNWYRLNGDYKTAFAHDDIVKAISGTKDVKGLNRYDTMLDAVVYNESKGEWGVGHDVVLVSGTSYADALAASSLAGVFGSPILTTPGDELGEQAEKAIKYFAGKSDEQDAKKKNELTVWTVGGPSAISEDVIEAIEDIDEDLDGNEISVKVNPVYGEDRQATSQAVADTVEYYVKGVENGKDAIWDNKTIFVANGWAWADALSTSSFSYSLAAPLILTDADGNLSDEQVEYLKAELDGKASVVVIGGPASDAYATLTQLDAKAGNLNYLHGVDRYDTSAEIVNYFEDEELDAIAVATGRNWPDALIGGAFVGANDGVLVLVGEKGKDANWDKALKAAIKNETASGLNVDGKLQKFIIGGEAAVSKATANLITRL